MRLLREPLLHFAIGGAILFAGYAWLNLERGNPTGPEPVQIGEGEVRWLKETWANQWLRGPSTEELQGLVADLVTEELFAREAREMGLDEHDTIVRRRLAQKLKFLVEDTSRLVEPTEEELRKFYEANAARFHTRATVSFTQIFFSPAQRKDATSDANAALIELKTAGRSDLAGIIGDRLLLGREFQDADEQSVASMFGPDFARAVFALQQGVWSGPLKSGYGVHLVSVAHPTAAKKRPFAEARSEILQEWRREKEKVANREYLARLREKYGVELDDSVKALLGTGPSPDVVAR